ncbi:MAG: hypothetical protein QXJ86_02915, partial [Nitrososphaerales archaeon]
LIEIILIPALTTYCKPTNFPTTKTTSSQVNRMSQPFTLPRSTSLRKDAALLAFELSSGSWITTYMKTLESK